MAADGTIIIDTRLDTSGIERGGTQIKKSLSSIGSMAKKIGGIVAAAFAVKKVVSFGKECLELGSDLQEVQNVVDSVFTTMSDKVDEFAESAAQTAGLSETIAKRYAGTFGAMSKSFGFSEQQAYDMSTALTQLSGDVASFYNITQDEAYTKLKSVFTGETESLKELGVVMTQTALDEYAMANGFGKTTSAMTEQEKVALRYRFVLNQLSTASGDFIRTSDGWANQVRIMKLQIESLKATIGQGLINLFTPIIKMINLLLAKLATVANAFKSFTELITGNKSSGNTGAVAAGITNELGSTSEMYDTAADSADGLADSTDSVTGSIKDNTDALKKQGKAAKGNVAAFDELNVISRQSEDSSGTAGKLPVSAGTADIGQVDYGKLADTKGIADETENVISEVLERLKQKIKEFFNVFKAAWESEGKNTINSIKYAFSEIGGLIASIAESFFEVWTNGTGQKMLNTILKITQDIFNFVGNIASRINEAWNKNSVGTSIIQGIANIIQKILDFIHKIASATAEWASELDFYPLLEAISNLIESLEPIIEKIGNFLYDIYTTIILPVCKFLIETALPGIIDAASMIFDFLGQHQWIIDAIGAALIGAFAAAKLAPLVTTIIGFIQGIITVISGGGGLMAAIQAVIAALGGPVTLAITAVVAAGVLLIKNWDSIKEVFGKVVGWVVEKSKEFASSVVNKFNDLKEKALNAFAILVESIKTKIENIREGFKNVLNWISTTFTNGWRKAWETIKDIFKSIFDTLIGIAKVPINGVIGLINGMLRGIVKGVNFAIGALNKMKIDVPDWVPGIGGDTWGFSIPTIEAPQIPYLAQGTVIPPRAREFAAVLGDNNRETEVVSPLSTMKQALLDALREYGGNGNNGTSNYIVLNIDGQEFIRWLQDQDGQYRSRNGYGLFEG